MRVWERGSGETLACGTGACASAVAAILNGYCERNREIQIQLLGGELSVLVADDDTVYLTGGCATVFEGEVKI
jgi:carbamoyl-phosphate synthase large subunit